MSARKNPIANLADTLKTAVANVDSVMMKRMPDDFKKMHKKPTPAPKGGSYGPKPSR